MNREGVSVRVCKKLFLRTFAISNGHVDRALRAQLNEGGSLHMDQRGKHKTKRCDIERVKEHVGSFPKYRSRYSRHDNPNRCYLSPELPVAKVYQLYKDKCSSEGESCELLDVPQGV